jgi:hypothetical protein
MKLMIFTLKKEKKKEKKRQEQQEIEKRSPCSGAICQP